MVLLDQNLNSHTVHRMASTCQVGKKVKVDIINFNTYIINDIIFYILIHVSKQKSSIPLV